MIKTQVALWTINKIITAWEKQKTKLEVAIKSLRSGIEKNNLIIFDKEEKLRLKKEAIEEKNKELEESITKAQNFKDSISTLFDKKTEE